MCEIFLVNITAQLCYVPIFTMSCVKLTPINKQPLNGRPGNEWEIVKIKIKVEKDGVCVYIFVYYGLVFRLFLDWVKNKAF